jgi:hypothetical protein
MNQAGPVEALRTVDDDEDDEATLERIRTEFRFRATFTSKLDAGLRRPSMYIWRVNEVKGERKVETLKEKESATTGSSKKVDLRCMVSRLAEVDVKLRNQHLSILREEAEKRKMDAMSAESKEATFHPTINTNAGSVVFCQNLPFYERLYPGPL